MNDRELTTPTVDLIAEAIDAGDAARAKRLTAAMASDFARNKDYSINWITSLLSFIGRKLGEDAVEEALRDFGERYLKDRRAALDETPARKRLEGLVRAMKANGATLSIEEDDEKWTVQFRCGSGGALIDSGAYGPPRNYLTLIERGPRTFNRESLPIYCSHCSVNNEMQGIEWTGAPITVELPPTAPGEPCVHHVYKDRSKIPNEVFDRVGRPRNS
ncbi:MAG: helix-turn-helix domain-containing protein [Actinomycetota bacterium]